jgi:hypothetical protein
MNHTNKSKGSVALVMLISIIVLAIGAIGVSVYVKKQSDLSSSILPINSQGNNTINPVTKCGFTVNNPLPNQVVSFPLTINTVVDRTDSASLPCIWGVFEAVAGKVELYDSANNLLATTFQMTAGNWMTTAPIYFQTTITPQNPIPSGTNLILIFTEDNAEGGPSDSVMVPIIAQ